MIALLGAIVTSLIGNTMALSRLLYAAGMSEYAKGDDASVLDVFTRADGIMYKNKEEMKKGAALINSAVFGVIRTTKQHYFEKEDKFLSSFFILTKVFIYANI